MLWTMPFGTWACVGALVGVALIALAIVRLATSASIAWQKRLDHTERKVARLLKELGVEDTDEERKAG